MPVHSANTVDSLLKIVKGSPGSSNAAAALNKLGWEMFTVGKYDLVMDYTAKAQSISESINYRMGLADAYNLQGVVYNSWGNNTKALEYYHKSLKINEEIGNARGISRNMMNIGILQMYLRDFPSALNYLTRSLKSCEQRQDKAGIGKCLSNMALVYRYQGNYQKSLEFYGKSLALGRELGDEEAVANSILNLGILYKDLGDTAITKNDPGFARTNYNMALDHYKAALKMQEKIGQKAGMAYCTAGIANVFIALKNFPEALNYLARANMLAIELDLQELIWSNAQDYREVYKQMGNYKKAVEYGEKAASLQLDLFSDENKQTLLRKEMQFDYEKKEAEINAASKAEKEKITAIAAGEKKEQQLIITCVCTGLALVICFAILMYKRYTVSQKQKKIIERQKHEVEEKSKEIQDSILYARRLQKAILPPQDYVDKHIADNFILYKPKDIVAGDFYWLEAFSGDPLNVPKGTANETAGKNLVMIAVADSTGHGVPGAMVSVVCGNALNRAVLEFGLRDPGKILDKTTDIVLETFMKSGEDIKDGMDISLLIINHQDKKIEWSGANNALWYIVPGQKQVNEIKADKQPVGKSYARTPFTTREVPYQKDMVFYLMTDGYADQFGGTLGKKFKNKQLQSLLLQIHQDSLEKQKTALNAAFDQWKTNLDQVDDVCIIGLRL